MNWVIVTYGRLLVSNILNKIYDTIHDYRSEMLQLDCVKLSTSSLVTYYNILMLSEDLIFFQHVFTI